jgi:hypothetical protein
VSLQFPQGEHADGRGRGRDIETRLHSMRGDASRAPDLTADILSRIDRQRPFADQRTLRVRRWSRIVGASLTIGLALCGGVIAAQWRQIAPAVGKHPALGPLSTTVAGVKSGSKTLKQMPAQLASLMRTPEGPRTDPEDARIVRAVATDVLAPMSTVLRVTPSLEASQTELDLAEAIFSGGQRVLQRAERLASSIRVGGVTGTGGAPPLGNETFADRLGRAVGGAPLGDGGLR